MIKYRIILLSAFLLAFAACKSPPPSNTPTRFISTPNLLELPDFLYVVGYITEDDYRKPCYWYGTSRIDIAYGAPQAIIVVDGTVYIAGCIVGENRRLFQWSNFFKPCYWKDMNRIDIPFPPKAINEGMALAITVADGTVYTAGTQYDSNVHSLPCYWQDTTMTVLTVPTEAIFSQANTIAVVNGIVYTAGSYSMPTRYFRQTDFMDTTDTGYGYYTISFNPADNEAVFAYPVKSIDTGIPLPCYWQGAKRTDLPIPSGYGGSVNAMTIVDDTVYTAGCYYDYTRDSQWSCYWQGTKRIYLSVPEGATNPVVNAISVINGIVYTTGYYRYGKSWKFCYWQDMERIDIPSPEETAWGSLFYTNSGDIKISNEVVCIAHSSSDTIYYWENNILNYSGTIGSRGEIKDICINK
jgi:hypothetical protein